MQLQPKILLVEDEEAVRVGLQDVFTFHGFTVESATNFTDGLDKCKRNDYSLLILDVMLPDGSGLALCQEIRKSKPEQPIIMLTAKSTDEDILTGFSLGADDYVTKPFSVAELVFRVKAVLRRTHREISPKAKLVIDNTVILDLSALTAEVNGKLVEFTKREVEVLLFLYQQTGRLVSRDELLVEVWGYDKDARIETRTVDIHIARLRRKIENDPKNPRILVTQRGEGYQLFSCKLIHE